jgi:hypothetical protein
MMAQFGPGKPRLGRSSGDDARQRQQWFWQCLGRIESRKPRIKQLAFPENIGCGLAGGDWSTYKETIRTFSRRNRDIQVDIIQLLDADDSESDSSEPSDWTDQNPAPDPHDDEQDHEEEQDSDDEVDDENNHEGNHNGRDDEEPHDLPAQWEACSTSSDGIGEFSSSDEEETGSEWGHDDSTDSVCSNERLRSVLKKRTAHEKVKIPINAHLGKDHTVRMEDDAKWYFVKDNRAVNTKEYKTKVIKHSNHDTMTRRRDKNLVRGIESRRVWPKDTSLEVSQGS